MIKVNKSYYLDKENDTYYLYHTGCLKNGVAGFVLDINYIYPGPGWFCSGCRTKPSKETVSKAKFMAGIP